MLPHAVYDRDHHRLHRDDRAFDHSFAEWAYGLNPCAQRTRDSMRGAPTPTPSPSGSRGVPPVCLASTSCEGCECHCMIAAA